MDREIELFAKITWLAKSRMDKEVKRTWHSFQKHWGDIPRKARLKVTRYQIKIEGSVIEVRWMHKINLSLDRKSHLDRTDERQKEMIKQRLIIFYQDVTFDFYLSRCREEVLTDKIASMTYW